MPQKSIRLRVQLWFGFLLAGLLAGFGATAYRLQQIAVMEKIDADLARRVDLVSAAFRSGDPGRGHPPRHAEDRGKGDFHHPPPPSDGGFAPHLPRERRAPVKLPADVAGQFTSSNRCYFAVWGEQEGVLLAQSSPDLAAVPRPASSPLQTLLLRRMRGTCREAYQYTERQDCVLAGCDIAPELAKLRYLAWEISASACFLWLLGLGGGFVLSGLLLHSIRHISGTAQRISEGNLSERIPTENMDRELGQLAEVLNATFGRLAAAFARQQQFTADAAHELRTPLAVIISDAQMALRRERSPEEYRDTIRACEEAAQKMRRLAESLLVLARLDAGGESGTRTAIDLADLAQASAERIRALAERREISIQLDLQPAAIQGHPEQIGRVFTNLLANAIDYNKPGGTIRIATRAEPEWAIATVADTGMGIAPEALPHVFDRFYRASAARAPADGHSGLGLAICKSIMDAHGGRIEVSSQPGQGTTFTLRWPLESPRT